MAGKEPDTGPTSRTVASNVRRLRGAQGMNFTELSERLQSAANWTINAVGIRRIESGERRVNPDDLMALAVALGVSPVTLLYPNTSDAGSNIEVTGLQPESARAVWEWLTASQWAYWAVEHGGNFERPSTFFMRVWPQWLLDAMGGESGLAYMDQIWNSARETTRQQLLDQEPEVLRGDD